MSPLSHEQFAQVSLGLQISRLQQCSVVAIFIPVLNYNTNSSHASTSLFWPNLLFYYTTAYRHCSAHTYSGKVRTSNFIGTISVQLQSNFVCNLPDIFGIFKVWLLQLPHTVVLAYAKFLTKKKKANCDEQFFPGFERNILFFPLFLFNANELQPSSSQTSVAVLTKQKHIWEKIQLPREAHPYFRLSVQKGTRQL